MYAPTLSEAILVLAQLVTKETAGHAPVSLDKLANVFVPLQQQHYPASVGGRLRVNVNPNGATKQNRACRRRFFVLGLQGFFLSNSSLSLSVLFISFLRLKLEKTFACEALQILRLQCNRYQKYNF